MAEPDAGPFSTGNPTGYIVSSINEGWSASEAFNTFRADGGQLATGTWFRLYGQVTDSIAREPAFSALDPYSIPDSSQYGEVSMGGGNKFFSSADIWVRSRGTGEVYPMRMGYMTDEGHTPAEAGFAGMDQLSNPDDPDNYPFQVLGFGKVRVYKTVPWGGGG